jgi:hypothetical protein
MSSTRRGPITGARNTLRAHWQRDADGALVCRWERQNPVTVVAPAASFRLTGRQRLPARSTALRALTAALDDPPTAA